MNLNEYKKRAFDADPGLKDEYRALAPEYEMIKQIIKARIEQNLTQEELADRIGIRQSNISRLESGRYNPSLDFLKKIAGGLGKELHIEFR
jgi:DNA-binding XRE family transcriptional regulator